MFRNRIFLLFTDGLTILNATVSFFNSQDIELNCCNILQKKKKEATAYETDMSSWRVSSFFHGQEIFKRVKNVKFLEDISVSLHGGSHVELPERNNVTLK